MPRHRSPFPFAGLSVAALLTGAVATPAAATDSPSVLFVRGADRSGGFLEADNDAERTEQLADINNLATNNGNHGWGQLAGLLRDSGFNVTQIEETVEAGAASTGQTNGVAVPFETLDLSVYDAIVFGSNNAEYNSAQVSAVDTYIRNGGGALFISDANFGSGWADAANSDQAFVGQYGLNVYQDQGTYALAGDELLVPDHPILDGVVGFDGEGVSPFEVVGGVEDVDITILARAEGSVRLNDDPNGGRGDSRSAGLNDAALVVAEVGLGRVVGHFDRNTFFNDNGAGSDLNRDTSRRDGSPAIANDDYARNLFTFLTVPEPASAFLLTAVLPLLARKRHPRDRA